MLYLKWRSDLFVRWFLAWRSRLFEDCMDVFGYGRGKTIHFTAILFNSYFSYVVFADMFEIWKNGLETAAYALTCALSRFQKHSSERGLVRYSLFLATYHGLKVISYGMGIGLHICFHLIDW